MSVPYEPAFVMRLLRRMSDDALRAIEPGRFQIYPAKVVAPIGVLAEIIAYERTRRFG